MGLLSRAKYQADRETVLKTVEKSVSLYPANLFFISLRSLIAKNLENNSFEYPYQKEQAMEKLFDNIVNTIMKIFSEPNVCVIGEQQELKAAIFSSAEICSELLKQHLSSILSPLEDYNDYISVFSAGISKTTDGIMAFLLPEL